jgi:hypothetical protein
VEFIVFYKILIIPVTFLLFMVKRNLSSEGKVTNYLVLGPFCNVGFLFLNSCMLFLLN